jgi:UDP-N-acetylglucosamine--N-acetylmuramyl-(pentapeptide) pyrophosphoryl-undecaprenol N-acetylglucosamine transferase
LFSVFLLLVFGLFLISYFLYVSAMKSTFPIVFAGGGTGGHLFPGLAVAEKLSANRPGVRIIFAGAGKPLERRQVAAAGFEYVALPSRPLPRKASEAIPFVVENMAGYFAAGRFLDEENVAGVVGLGGYASVAMGRAAARRRLPLVLLEQNAVFGKANRWLSRFASLNCASFQPDEQQIHARCPVRWTGNPIRRFDVAQASCLRPAAGTAAPPQRIIVLGGSGGARSLNENVPRALYKVRHLIDGWEIVHQSGEADLSSTRELYCKFALEARVEAFWPDLPALLAGSSLAICRAGGTTLAELAATATPALLLPYPHATDDHQRKNADVFVSAGAARLLDEREIDGRLDDRLAEMLEQILVDAQGRATMGQAMNGLARPHAAAHVATLVWSLVSSRARSPRERAAA